MRIINAPFVPPGTILLVPDTTSVWDVPFRLYSDPWPPAPYPVSEVGEVERQRGLNFLASLLDEMCEGYGWDPDEVWRTPKAAEQMWWQDRTRYRIDAMLSMPIVNPRASTIIQGV